MREVDVVGKGKTELGYTQVVRSEIKPTDLLAH